MLSSGQVKLMIPIRHSSGDMVDAESRVEGELSKGYIVWYF